MAVTIDAVKRFQDDRVVVYSFANYNKPADSGVLVIDVRDVDRWLVFPPDASRLTAERPLLKALAEQRATSSWPDKVSHIS